MRSDRRVPLLCATNAPTPGGHANPPVRVGVPALWRDPLAVHPVVRQLCATTALVCQLAAEGGVTWLSVHSVGTRLRTRPPARPMGHAPSHAPPARASSGNGFSSTLRAKVAEKDQASTSTSRPSARHAAVGSAAVITVPHAVTVHRAAYMHADLTVERAPGTAPPHSLLPSSPGTRSVHEKPSAATRSEPTSVGT